MIVGTLIPLDYTFLYNKFQCDKSVLYKAATVHLEDCSTSAPLDSAPFSDKYRVMCTFFGAAVHA